MAFLVLDILMPQMSTYDSAKSSRGDELNSSLEFDQQYFRKNINFVLISLTKDMICYTSFHYNLFGCLVLETLLVCNI